jgi:Predicted nucleotide-binding protein containing TIR-like domain
MDVFIGSSTEAEEAASEVQAILQAGGFAEAHHWRDVFPAGEGTLRSLAEVAQRCDFAILILSGDDVTISREMARKTVRDNIVFELGYFMGVIGQSRTFMLHNSPDRVIIASDLAGITRQPYNAGSDGDLRNSLRSACTELTRVMKRLGPRMKTVRLPPNYFVPVHDEWFAPYGFGVNGHLFDWPKKRFLDFRRGLPLYWLSHDIFWTITALLTNQSPNHIRRGLTKIVWQMEQNGLLDDQSYGILRNRVQNDSFTPRAWGDQAREELAGWLVFLAHNVGDRLNNKYIEKGQTGEYYPLPPRPDNAENVRQLERYQPRPSTSL